MKILFITHHPIEDAGNRYRIHQFLPYLQSAGYECTVRPFSTSLLFKILHAKGHYGNKVIHTAFCAARRATDLLRISEYDIVVVHREAFPFLMPAIEMIIAKLSKRLVFSFDDAIYAGHPPEAVLRDRLLYRFKYGNGVDSILARSDHIIAGNQTLADYARQFNKSVSVVPTVISLQKYCYREPVDHADSAVTIGWTGSSSTSPYLHKIEPALQRLAEIHGKKVRFRFFGDRHLRLNLPRAEYLPFRLDSELEDLRTLDIGIMPMPDSVWTRGKCSFKAVQYMALGIPSVVTPVGMAADLVRHEVDGLHATCPEEWFQALLCLVADVEMRRRIARKARSKIEREYCVEVWGPRFVDLISRVCVPHPTPHFQKAAGATD